MKFLNKIDGANQILTDSSNRFISDSEKDDLHSHLNKSIIDNFSEVDSSLKYKGKSIMTKSKLTWGELLGL